MTPLEAYKIGIDFKKRYYPDFMQISLLYDFGDYYIVFYMPIKEEYDPYGNYNNPLYINKETKEIKSIFYVSLLGNNQYLNKEYTKIDITELKKEL